MKKSRKYILFLLIFLISCPSYSADTLSSEDYKVYSAVLEQMEEFFIEVYGRNPQSSILIDDSTIVKENFEDASSLTGRKIKKNYSVKALKLLCEESKTCFIDSDSFKLNSMKVTSIDCSHTMDSLHRIQLNDPFFNKLNALCDMILNKYNVGLFFAFSRIAYNQKQNKAVLTYEYWCGSSCGEGFLIEMKKTKKGWKIQNKKQIFVS